MTTAIRKTANPTSGRHDYVEAIVNASDYPTSEWEHDPDITAVANVDRLYWKWDGTAVVEMPQVEKDSVNEYHAETTNPIQQIVNDSIFTMTSDTYVSVPNMALVTRSGPCVITVTMTISATSNLDIISLRLVYDGVAIEGSTKTILIDDGNSEAWISVTLHGVVESDGVSTLALQTKINLASDGTSQAIGSFSIRDKSLIAFQTG